MEHNKYTHCIRQAVQIRRLASSLERGDFGEVTAEQEETAHAINQLALDLINELYHQQYINTRD